MCIRDRAYTACEAAPRKTDGVRVKEFSLLRPVLEADFIIDLPKVKMCIRDSGDIIGQLAVVFHRLQRLFVAVHALSLIHI